MKSDKFSPAGWPAISRIVSPPRKPALAPGLSFEDGEDLGGWISDQAEAFGEVGDFHGGRGGAGSGFENKAEVIGGGKFESSAEVDRVGPDGAVSAVHDFSFCFRHEAFSGDLGGDSGKGVLVDATSGFLFAFGESDGAKDGAEDGSCGGEFYLGRGGDLSRGRRDRF